MLFDLKTHFVYLSIYQLVILDDNNISLLNNRRLSILILDRLVLLIILGNY